MRLSTLIAIFFISGCADDLTALEKESSDLEFPNFSEIETGTDSSIMLDSESFLEETSTDTENSNDTEYSSETEDLTKENPSDTKFSTDIRDIEFDTENMLAYDPKDAGDFDLLELNWNKDTEFNPSVPSQVCPNDAGCLTPNTCRRITNHEMVEGFCRHLDEACCRKKIETTEEGEEKE